MGSGRAVVEELKLEAVALDEVRGEINLAADLKGFGPVAADGWNHRGFKSHAIAPELQRLFEIADADANVMRIDSHTSPGLNLFECPEWSVDLPWESSARSDERPLTFDTSSERGTHGWSA